jgi:hypothetical protein
MKKRADTRVIVIFFVIAISGGLLKADTPVPPSADHVEWGQFKKDVELQLGGARDWLSKALGFGQQMIGSVQSVEMLPYRYVFLVSFLGGISGALLVYALQRSVKKIKKYEVRKKDIRQSFFRPTTFRDQQDEESSQVA